jgi:hypothetical protein
MIHQIKFIKGNTRSTNSKENKIYNKNKEIKTPTRPRLVSNHHSAKKRERSEIAKRWQKTSL